MASFFTYLIEVSISLGVFYLFYHLLLRKDTFFSINRMYLLITAGFSLTIPLFNFTFASSKINGEILYIMNIVVVGENQIQHSLAEQMTALDYLFILYISITLFLVIRLFYQLLRIAFLSFRGTKRIINGKNVIFLDEEIIPFSFLNRIYLGSGYDPNSTDTIILHESIHVNGKHSLDVLFFELLTAFQWFNPVIWLYRNTIKEIHEYIADREVLRSGVDRKDYGNLIISSILNARAFAPGNSFNFSITKRRFIMMLKSNSRRTALLKFLLVLPLAALISFSFACSEDQKQGVDVSDLKSKQVEKSSPTNVTAFEAIEIDNMPTYKSDVIKTIQQNIKYPAEAMKANISGKVRVRFLIGEDGKIEKSFVSQGIGYGCDEEALRVVNMLDQWSKPMKDGKPVSVWMEIPIMFKLR
jgi:TonB family protein